MSKKQFPIYNIINSCAYADAPGRSKGNKSYGIYKHGDLTCRIGTSSKRSYKFFKTTTEHEEIKPNLHEYRFYLDGKLIKRAVYDYELDEIEIETLTN